MSEEEKNIELLKTKIKQIENNRELSEWEIEVKSALNLIENQQKEIDINKLKLEELTTSYEKEKEYAMGLYYENQGLRDDIDMNYISKFKILEILNEYAHKKLDYAPAMYQELKKLVEE